MIGLRAMTTSASLSHPSTGEGMSRRSVDAVLVVALFAVLAVAAGCGSPPREQDGNGTAAGSTAVAVDTAADPVAADDRVETYYVHLRAGVDPRDFAASRGLTVVEVVPDDGSGLVTRLTSEQRDALEADSLVRSLARRVHSGGEESDPPIRSLGGDSAGG